MDDRVRVGELEREAAAQQLVKKAFQFYEDNVFTYAPIALLTFLLSFLPGMTFMWIFALPLLAIVRKYQAKTLTLTLPSWLQKFMLILVPEQRGSPSPSPSPPPETPKVVPVEYAIPNPLEFPVDYDLLGTMNSMLLEQWKELTKDCVDGQVGRSSRLFREVRTLLESQVSNKVLKLKSLYLQDGVPKIEAVHVGTSHDDFVLINLKVHFHGGANSQAVFKVLSRIIRNLCEFRINQITSTIWLQIRVKPKYWIAPFWSTAVPADVRLICIPQFDFVSIKVNLMKLVPNFDKMVKENVVKATEPFVQNFTAISLVLKPAQSNVVLEMDEITKSRLQTGSYKRQRAVTSTGLPDLENVLKYTDGARVPRKHSFQDVSDVADGDCDEAEAKAEAGDVADGRESYDDDGQVSDYDYDRDNGLSHVQLTMKEIRYLPRYAGRKPRKHSKRQRRRRKYVLGRVTILKTVEYDVSPNFLN